MAQLLECADCCALMTAERMASHAQLAHAQLRRDGQASRGPSHSRLRAVAHVGQPLADIPDLAEADCAAVAGG